MMMMMMILERRFVNKKKGSGRWIMALSVCLSVCLRAKKLKLDYGRRQMIELWQWLETSVCLVVK